MPQPDFLSQVAIKSDYIAGATTLSKMTLNKTIKNRLEYDNKNATLGTTSTQYLLSLC